MANINVTSNGSVVTGDNDIINLNISGGGDVTITADPGDDVDFFKIKFLDDTEADSVTVDLSTFSQDGLRIDILQYDPNDSIGFIGGFDFYVDPDNVDEIHFSYIGADGNTYTGVIRAMDGGEKDFTDPFQPITVICFADGTLIDTPEGPVPVETLRPGDMVMTRDSGALPLRWVGRRELSADVLRTQPGLCPIEVARDTFGPGQPSRDLVLSPNHRLMLSDWRVEMLFGEFDVLAAVRMLKDCPGITPAKAPKGIAYNHLLFDRHEIVVANGMPCESLFPGPEALGALDDCALSEIRAIFPEAIDETVDVGPPARRILRAFEAHALASAMISGRTVASVAA
ncbi:Hint domain-containing protein [Roseibacterium beibuensis]|uniref:Hedgehog/Intein (Hint) domain-containing protein n=1 Tax=[Roseibacterium] beibuensis TaxID=1193142 RepID=A0ABP9KSF3_9RHOB|nr:Hint domain-containing protein [Roseibacterium beibuensis]MCS6622324.1 Hint domain-containing protein [Roseibacterium beibuensis]